MSTRRARIKAVASLPVRRKNNEASERSKISTPKGSDSKPATPKRSTASAGSLIENQVDSINFTTSLPQEDQPQQPQSIAAPLTSNSQVKPAPSPRSVKPTPSPRSVKPTPSPRSTAAVPNTLQPSASPIIKRHNIKFVGTPSSSLPKSPQITRQSTPKHLTQPPTATPEIQRLFSEDISKITVTATQSEPENEVLDGIVPLSNKNLPQPIDVLKSDLISDDVEVLFDPIVPLPSPSKGRPKLRPAPRLALRRSSVQGSASESEDENRRALLGTPGAPPVRQRHDSAHVVPPLPHREVSRKRHDSFSSIMTQSTKPQTVPPPSSPLDKSVTKNRRTEASRRMVAMRRQRRRADVSRQQLTMYDLIFYNPTNNPILPEDGGQTTSIAKAVAEPEETVDEPDSPSPPPDAPAAPAATPPAAAAPVPQIKLGPNGEIMLDEKSLVIEQTESERKLSSSVVVESGWVGGGTSSGGRYSRARRTRDWSDEETVRFYRALAALGTDFTLMAPMFPDRNRRDLKLKFKKEERLNGALIDKALRSQTQWDGERLQTEFAEERKVATEKAETEREALHRQRREERLRIKIAKSDGIRISKAAKALEELVPAVPSPAVGNNADTIIQRAIEEKRRQLETKRQAVKAKRKVQEHVQKNEICEVAALKVDYATLTLNRPTVSPKLRPPPPPPPLEPAKILSVPANIENGSLVVLTVNDPKDPGKKMLQTYISSDGKLTPVALPSTLLNSVVGYMKKGTPKSASSSSSPLLSPHGSGSSHEASRSSVIVHPSPNKRSRHDSFTITPL